MKYIKILFLLLISNLFFLIFISNNFLFSMEENKNAHCYPEMDLSTKIMVAWCLDESTAYVWDREDKKEILQLSHTGCIDSLNLYNSEKIVTISDDGIIHMWSGLTGEKLLQVRFDDRIVSVDFNTTETEMVIVMDDGKIRILTKEASK